MENKISTRKLLLTVSMALLLVVAVLGFGLFGINTGATSPEMGEIVAKADVEPETISEVEVEFTDNFAGYYRVGGHLYKEAKNISDIFKIDATKPYMIVDVGIFVYNESSGKYEHDTDYNGFVAGVKYAIVAVVATDSDFTAMGGSNASGYLFASNVTVKSEGWGINYSNDKNIEVLYKLPVLEAPTISEVEIALSDNFSNYYRVGGHLYKEALGISDVFKIDTTKPYMIVDAGIFVYNEGTGKYEHDTDYNGFVAGVKYAIVAVVATGSDFTYINGSNLSGYKFASNATVTSEGWGINYSNDKNIEVLYKLPVLEAPTISEVEVEFTDNFAGYYRVGGHLYKEALGISDVFKIDTTKPYMIVDAGIFVYNEGTGKYEHDTDYNGFVAGVRYAIAAVVATGSDFTHINGSNLSGYKFASNATVTSEGWRINYSNDRNIEALYELPVLEAPTISEVEIALSDNFANYYRVGGHLYNEALGISDVFKIDATKPYMIVDAGIFVYNESNGKYELDADYNGFVAGVKYAIAAIVATGNDFTAMGGSNASGYLFASNATITSEGWNKINSSDTHIEAIYELPVLEAQTISEVDIALSDNFSNYHRIGGHPFEEAEAITDIFKFDTTEPYMVIEAGIFVYNESNGKYEYDSNYNGFVAGVKYAIVAIVATGFDFTGNNGSNASDYLFASEVTNVNDGWSTNVLAGQYLETLYELPVLEAQTITEVDIALSDNFFDYYHLGEDIFEDNHISDLIKVDVDSPYFIDGANIYIYDEDAGKYVYDEDFNGFVAGVKYAFNVHLVTGYDFTEFGGINASDYLFANVVTNVNDGWSTIYYSGQYIDTLYELPVLEAQTISEIDVDFDDALFNYYYIGGTFYDEVPSLIDLVKIDTTKTYLIDGIGIFIYNESTGNYEFNEDFNGFVAGVKYAFAVALRNGNNASAPLFASEVTNVNDGWITNVLAGQYLETVYALPVLEAEQFDASELVITLTNELVYNGTAQTQNATVAYKGATLVNGVDYTISDNVQTNAGNYVMTITLIGSYDYTTTCNFAIAKATYDMSGISMANKTVTYNGETHSLAIEGTLPTGVSVSYNNNDKADAGVYTVTANFTGNANYNAIAPITATLTIEKATYDMSAISMADKTVTYNGETHSLAIEGTLPTGVSVSYNNNDKTDAGVYTVTANFTGNANYNAIAPISATLTIKAIVFEDTEKDEETGKPVVKVESDNGFDPTTELVVEVVAVEIEIAEIKVEISDKEDIAVAYDVSLFQDGVSVQPNGIIRVKMLIPANLLGIQFRIVHIHNGQEIGNVDYTVDDNYAVIETDKLSAFVFIYEPSTTPASINPLIGWICLGVILFVALVALLIIFLNKRTIKFNANGIAFENEEFGEIKAYVGEKIKLPVPFAQNYKFSGWYYDKECQQKAEITKMGMKSVVLYAKWEENTIKSEKIAQNNND